MLETTLSKFKSLTDSFKKVTYQVEALKTEHSRTVVKIESLKTEETILEETSETLKKIFEQLNKKSIEGVENLVSYALNSIWEDRTYQFKIISKERGATSTNKFVLIKNGIEVDIMDGSGGGLVDIVALVLRLIFTLKAKPELRPVLFLDEPFQHASANYHEKIGELLTELIEKLGLTIVMVTHTPIIENYASRRYTLEEIEPDTVIAKELVSGTA
jgi:DNA repair exonuclease SbcCD ATPase subunit